MAARSPNHSNGRKNAAPIKRPRSRCAYSHQKMPLTSAGDRPRLTSWYPGVAWYWANAACQSAAESGGSVPTIGCHSVIDRPEWVSRVTPPTTIIANTSAQHASSHAATARGRARCAAGETAREAMTDDELATASDY